MAILKPLTFKQTKLKEFRERLSEYCSWELEGTSTTDRLERREQFESFLSSTIDEAERVMVKECIKLIEIDTLKLYGLTEETKVQSRALKLLRAKLGGVKE
jgi:hypothetical protein